MSRTTIAVVDSKRLLAVFGPRDQHLRRIRSALGVGVAARDDAIQIEGDEAAVQRAAEVFEGLDQVARRSGVVTEADVDRLLNAGRQLNRLRFNVRVGMSSPGPPVRQPMFGPSATTTLCFAKGRPAVARPFWQWRWRSLHCAVNR